MIPLRDWLSEKPYALAMSAGYFGFFAHAGLLSVLEEQGLTPSSVSGASAGALIAGLWASGLSCKRIEEELFRQKLHSLLQADTFETARVPVQISVFDLFRRKTEVLRSGNLCDAIAASCALPVLFHPVVVNSRMCIDGGVLDRPALCGVPQDVRVLYHHLASKSPWRRYVPVPQKRESMVSIAISNMPRVNPFHLERGQFAFFHARNQIKYALNQLVPETGAELTI